MNPQTLLEARKLFSTTKNTASRLKKTKVVVAPPFIFISSLAGTKSRLYLGAQNVFWETRGAFTGEISPSMLSEMGVQYVIVGHSERRAIGETDEIVSKKLKTLIREEIIPILCVGESERDNHGHYLSFLSTQIKKSLAGIQKRNIKNIIIAYEPIWAIGKTASDAMDSHKLHETVLYIRKVLSEMYGRDIAKAVSIIYGGSAEPGNVAELMKNGNVMGFLVGHASLDVKGFSEILKIVDKS